MANDSIAAWSSRPGLDSLGVTSRDFLCPVMPVSSGPPPVIENTAIMQNGQLTLASVIKWPLISVVLGLVIHAIYPHHWPFRTTVIMLADALAVGAFIAVTLELFLSRQLIDHTASELSEKLVGARPARGSASRHWRHCAQNGFRQDQSSSRYVIRPTEDPSHVVVSITRRYRTWNHGKGPQRYSPKLAEESFHKPRFLSLDCFHGNSAYCHLDESQLKPELKRGSNSQSVTGTEVVLAPIGRDRFAEPFLVMWQMEITVPADYSDVIAFGHPTVGPFEIEMAGLPDGFEFVATEDPALSVTGNVWRYHRAFLPGQHLRVWWRPKTEPTS